MDDYKQTDYFEFANDLRYYAMDKRRNEETRNILKQAADMLQSAANASSEPWVSVEDRTPIVGDDVIVAICRDVGDYKAYYTAVGWYCGEKFDNIWIVDNEFCTMVTHWKSFPRYPKEKKK